MISHAEVREALELAAVEPGGLDRMIAGDTPDAGLVAGHLAGCVECTGEFVRLSRSAAILRDTIGLQAPPELRERTLAFVHVVGRPRDPQVAAVETALPVAAAVTAAPSQRESGVDSPGITPPLTRRPIGPRIRDTFRPGSPFLSWVVATAAIVLIAVAVTAGVVSNRRDSGDQPPTGNDAAALAQVAEWSIRIAAQPDAERVRLTSATGSAALGTLQFSPNTGEMVAVASGLARPTAGQSYGCWVEIDGRRKRLGPMFFGSSGIAYWVGDVALLAHVPAGSIFGMSLTDAGGTVTTPDPVLSGAL